MQITETPLLVKLENDDLKEVKKFTYLGSIMSKSDATVKGLANRLLMAKSSFVQLNKVLRSPNISEKNKINIYNSNVLSVLLYGAQCWMASTLCLRKISRIYGPQKKLATRNVEVNDRGSQG